jgi:hypothetical protein
MSAGSVFFRNEPRGPAPGYTAPRRHENTSPLDDPLVSVPAFKTAASFYTPFPFSYYQKKKNERREVPVSPDIYS